MGWVPTDDARPVFIVGDQVIGQDGMMPGKAAPGVTADVLAKGDLFGVVEPADDDALRIALRNVVNAYQQVGPTPATRRSPWPPRCDPPCPCRTTPR